MTEEVKGLVLRTTNIGDADRLITIYTEEKGIIATYAKNSRSIKSRILASTSQFCYASFVLNVKGDKYWIKEADLKESFFNLRRELDALALAGYIAEVLEAVGTSDPEPDLLRLALNTLYVIAEDKVPKEKAKAAFEMRLAATIGFLPDIVQCHTCGAKTGEFFFDIMAGAVECITCHRKAQRTHTTLAEEHESHIIAILPEAARTALAYSIYAPLEKLFSFNISDEDCRFFVKAAESYLLNHLERGFKTLDFYNEVKPK